MSGVEVTKEQKESQVHVCESCMNTIVQTFGHMQEQIAQLNKEKLKLQMELEQSKKQQKQKEQTLEQKIKALEQKLAAL
ncbi:MAG: hypothetical protein ACOWW1_08145 [archaeon]|nr:hypothetical protein [Candidatus Bathyarchaeum sp.]